MKRRPLLFLLTALALAPAAHGQPEATDPEEGLVDRGIGWATTAVGQRPLPYSRTFQGWLVALPPVVELLGGDLDVEPLGQGHTLSLAGEEVVLGPESAVMTNGEQIIPLSQAPRIGEGGIHVPIDLLERTYGDRLGFAFRWSERELRLVITRRPLRRLPMEVVAVSYQGVSTLVLQFGATPRYRVVRESSEILVEVLGDRVVAGDIDVHGDPLVKSVEVDGERIRIRLDEGAVATEPYVVRRDPWFQLVFDVSRQSTAGGTSRTAERPRTPSRGGEMKVVIDPGHGGSERGAVGKSGSQEKDLTLVLARTLKRNLERRLPVRVVLTRDEDGDLPLETRTAIANQNRADLFVSLHLNSEVGSKARGAETYFLSMEASDAEAASTAEFENRGASTDRSEEFGLQLILWDLAQTHHLAESQRIANLIQQELNEALNIRDRGVKQAPFRVLMGATMPAVLVELGFLSNPDEEAKLETAAYRAELVSALVRAVARYRAQSQPRSSLSTDAGLP